MERNGNAITCTPVHDAVASVFILGRRRAIARCMQKVVIAVVVIVGANGRNDVNEDGEGGGGTGKGSAVGAENGGIEAGRRCGAQQRKDLGRGGLAPTCSLRSNVAL